MITCFSSVDVAGVCRLLLTRHRTDIIITIIMSKIIKASSSVSTIRRENLCYKGCRAILILLLIDCYLLCREANSFKIVNDHARLIGDARRISRRDTNNKNNVISINQEPRETTVDPSNDEKMSPPVHDSENIEEAYADNVEEEQQQQEEEDEDENSDSAIQSQNFFQSFAPLFSGSPLTHSRPLLYPDQAFRGSYRQGNFRELPFNSIGSGDTNNDNLLGSGNFGVIKGGTYYANNADQEDADFGLDDVASYTSYLGNGHSRPAYYKRNPLPAYRNGGDFFANFRDFADIMGPTKSAFSHYYVVYANQNSSSAAKLSPSEFENESAAAKNVAKLPAAGSAKSSSSAKNIYKEKQHVPNNILEQLDMLDNVNDSSNNNYYNNNNANNENEKSSEEKLSESKRKLMIYNQQLRNKQTNKAKSELLPVSTEIADPLIALS